jgi:gamma-glutamyltranspeptidase / glutathione hydrolase
MSAHADVSPPAAGHGVIAAGHPRTAQAGAQVLREGGNAVDAAVAAMLASCVAEPLLTGLGAGGHMIVAAGTETVVLDFFVEAPRRPTDGSAAELDAVDVSFGDAVQVFYIGPASCGIYGMPAGVCAAARRWGTMSLTALAAPAAKLAREGVALNAQQAYIAKILGELLCSTPQCAALWAPGGVPLREGDVLRDPDLAQAIERLGSEGATPFYRGDIAAAVCDQLASRGGFFDPQQLAGYVAIEREPLHVRFRDREVLTNPPPSAGGSLLAYALRLLDRDQAERTANAAGIGWAGPPSTAQLIEAMEAAQAQRTPQFMEGLGENGFLERFRASRLGATTHISVLDRDGMACGVTSTNGEGSGIVVPGTGIHLNNVMGEEDLNPLGFHRHPAGRRMPSMMAPTLVMRSGEVELVLGSAGSNRIRSALLQTIIGVVDRELPVEQAVSAPRVHFENGVIYHEPGIDMQDLHREDREIVRFHDRNLFFGGVQAVQRRDSRIIGAGDPRRGGVAIRA